MTLQHQPTGLARELHSLAPCGPCCGSWSSSPTGRYICHPTKQHLETSGNIWRFEQHKYHQKDRDFRRQTLLDFNGVFSSKQCGSRGDQEKNLPELARKHGGSTTQKLGFLTFTKMGLCNSIFIFLIPIIGISIYCSTWSNMVYMYSVNIHIYIYIYIHVYTFYEKMGYTLSGLAIKSEEPGFR